MVWEDEHGPACIADIALTEHSFSRCPGTFECNMCSWAGVSRNFHKSAGSRHIQQSQRFRPPLVMSTISSNSHHMLKLLLACKWHMPIFHNLTSLPRKRLCKCPHLYTTPCHAGFSILWFLTNHRLCCSLGQQPSPHHSASCLRRSRPCDRRYIPGPVR